MTDTDALDAAAAYINTPEFAAAMRRADRRAADAFDAAAAVVLTVTVDGTPVDSQVTPV